MTFTRWAWFLFFAIAAVLIILPLESRADPFAKASNGQVTITLYTDACELKEVSNLPKKAIWTQGAKTFQGCWGASEVTGTVMAYFDDRTVAAIPMQFFERVQGA